MKKTPGLISLRPSTARRGFSMDNALRGNDSTRDPLANPREIRIPAEGVRALGLPDDSGDVSNVGSGAGDTNADGKSGKSGKGKRGDTKSPDGSSSDTPNDDKLGWFDVTIVDAWGMPVGGVDLEISYQGTRKKVRTASTGNVRLEEVDSSFGSVRFVDVPAARDIVRPRWVKKQPDSLPEVTNPQVVGLAFGMGDVSITSETPLTIVIVKPLPRVRLVGMHFDTNKSFMRPTAVEGIRAAVAEFEKSPTGNLLIVGHTDSVGGDQENLGLSVDRAESVKAYLKNDVHAWEVWFDKPEKDKTRWGERERTQMISALPCEQSVAGFQTFSNETRGTSLAVDGKFGPATRKALIEAYMGLGGTTLPEHIGVSVHGCGEFFPAEDVGDAVEDEENRRVEMYCFDDEIAPPVPSRKAKKSEPEYSQWSKQVTKDIDVTTEDVETLFVTIFSPTEKQERDKELLICDATGAVKKVRPEAEGTRAGDNVTFDLDPATMPNPTQLKVRRGFTESLIGEPFDPTRAARELRTGKNGGSSSGGGTSLGAAPTTKASPPPPPPSIAVEVKWKNANHPLLKPIVIDVLAKPVAAPATAPTVGTPTNTTVGSNGCLTFIVDSHTAELVLTVEVPEPNPTASTPPILLFSQGISVTSPSTGSTAVKFSPQRRATMVAKFSAIGTNTKIEVELDLEFLDVTNHAKTLPKNDTLVAHPTKFKNRLMILERTSPGGPSTWALAVPKIGMARASVNAFLYFTNELKTHIGPKGKELGAYAGCDDADYERVHFIMSSDGPGTYMHAVQPPKPSSGPTPPPYLVAKVFPRQGWDEQLHAAEKNLVMMMPLPRFKDFGDVNLPAIAAADVLQAVVRALWYEDAAASSVQFREDLSIERLAVGGWSSGTNTLINWIVTDSKPLSLADEVYFFDGVFSTIWPGAPQSPLATGLGVITGRTLSTWLSLKPDRRLVLIPTSYTLKPALDDFPKLKAAFPGQVTMLPSDQADYVYTDPDYARALRNKSSKELLELTPPAPPVGTADVEEPTVSGTEVTGVWIDDFPSAVGKGLNKTSTVDVEANQKTRTVLAFRDDSVSPPKIVTHKVSRASKEEASYLFRYLALSTTTVAVVPIVALPFGNAANFEKVAARLDDRPGDEPTLAGRLRHAWSVMGGTISGGKFEGHLQKCLAASKFT